ncbi:Hypothetical predicted protein [Cloeon dipterum]|nr:Hypothetical predicted protein [Cloeon dipterum]
MGERLIPLSQNFPKVDWLAIKYKTMDMVADCVIKVVNEDKTVTEVRALISDLVIGSRCLLDLAAPISGMPNGKKCELIDDVEANVIKLAVEFIHLNGNLLSEVDNLDTCLELVRVAVEFEILGLGPFCVELLLNKFLSVQNIWSVFNSNYEYIFTAAACLKFLATKTKDCLQNESFHDLDEIPFRLFLSLKKMADVSEIELVSKILQISERKTDPRTFFRNYCLQKLRLLALKADDFSNLRQLFSYLSQEELRYLTIYTSPLKCCLKTLPPPTFCSNASERTTNKRLRTLTFVPEGDIQSPKDIFRAGNWFEPKGNLEFSLELRTKKCVKLTGFEIFCELDLEKEFLDDSREAENYTCNLQGEYSVSVFKESFCRKIEFPAKLEKDGWVFVAHCVIVPAGARLTLRLRIERPRFLRNLLASPDFQEHENTFFEPPKISVKTDEGDLTNDYCILKKISYSEM